MISGTGRSGGLLEILDGSFFGAGVEVCDACFETSRVGSCAATDSVHASAATETAVPEAARRRSLVDLPKIMLSMPDLLVCAAPQSIGPAATAPGLSAIPDKRAPGSQ